MDSTDSVSETFSNQTHNLSYESRNGFLIARVGFLIRCAVYSIIMDEAQLADS